MKIINLTPHAINAETIDGKIVVFPPSGIIARCKLTNENIIGRTTDQEGNEFNVVSAGTIEKIENLPEPEEGVIYITSSIVAVAAKLYNRNDLLYPGEFIRDENGNIIGCRNFKIIER